MKYYYVRVFLVYLMFTIAACSSVDLLTRSGDEERPGYRVRVLVAHTKSHMSLDSDGVITISNKGDGTLLHRSSGRTIRIVPDRIPVPVLVGSSSGIVRVNGTSYRGLVEVFSHRGGVSAVNIIDIEDYLCSVVPGEIPPSWPSEALKAQAVAARTYAFHHMTTGASVGYDLDATTSFQIYKGAGVEDPRTSRAVFETAGEVLTRDGRPIIAFFHSTCGGKTAAASAVWRGDDVVYLNETSCGFCEGSPYYRWTEELTLDEISTALQRRHRSTGPIRKISLRRESDRIVQVIVSHTGGTITLTGNDFRLLFPPKKNKSLYFSCEKISSGLLLKGRGWGHGVGLCQYGARGMAENGSRYRKILAHYYSGVNVVCLYENRKFLYAGNP